MDVPVIEIQIVLLVLLFIAILILLKEIRSFKELLFKEKTELERFELDLGKLEKNEPKKPSDHMITHLKTAVDQGLPEKSLRSALKQVGWSKQAIDSIIKKIKRSR